MHSFSRDPTDFFVLFYHSANPTALQARKTRPPELPDGRALIYYYYIVGAYWTMKFTEVSPWGSSPKV